MLKFGIGRGRRGMVVATGGSTSTESIAIFAALLSLVGKTQVETELIAITAATLTATGQTVATPADGILDTTPPTFVSGTANANTITLTFSEAVQASDSSGIALRVNGGSNRVITFTSGQGTATLTGTIVTPVTAGQAVTFEYAPAAANSDLRDMAGNEMAALAATAITNLTSSTETITVTQAALTLTPRTVIETELVSITRATVTATGQTVSTPADSGAGDTVSVTNAAPAITGQTVATPADVGSIFVATTGNNANPGTAALPKATLAGAAAAVSAGQYVIVRGGTYSVLQTFGTNGTSTNRITIKPYQGETVIFDGTSTAVDTSLIDISGDYVTFRDFTVRNAKRTGIAMWENQNSWILYNTVHTCVKGGIWVGGGTVGASANNLISGNTVYDCVRENLSEALSGAGGWAVAIQFDNSDGSTATHNYAYESWGEGIAVMESIGCTFTHNKVKDCYSVGFYCDNGQDATFQQNTYWSTNATYYRSGQGAAYGGVICNEVLSRPLPSSGITFNNNRFTNSPSIVFYSTFGANTGLSSSSITPNEDYASTAAYQAARGPIP